MSRSTTDPRPLRLGAGGLRSFTCTAVGMDTPPEPVGIGIIWRVFTRRPATVSAAAHYRFGTDGRQGVSSSIGAGDADAVGEGVRCAGWQETQTRAGDFAGSHPLAVGSSSTRSTRCKCPLTCANGLSGRSCLRPVHDLRGVSVCRCPRFRLSPERPRVPAATVWVGFGRLGQRLQLCVRVASGSGVWRSAVRMVSSGRCRYAHTSGRLRRGVPEHIWIWSTQPLDTLRNICRCGTYHATSRDHRRDRRLCLESLRFRARSEARTIRSAPARGQVTWTPRAVRCCRDIGASCSSWIRGMPRSARTAATRAAGASAALDEWPNSPNSCLARRYTSTPSS